jgi:hypothetical protein
VWTIHIGWLLSSRLVLFPLLEQWNSFNSEHPTVPMKCFCSGVFNNGPFDYLLMRMISICEVHACNCMQHILCVCMKVDVMLICVYPAFALYHGITDEERPCRRDQILSTRLGSLIFDSCQF